MQAQASGADDDSASAREPRLGRLLPPGPPGTVEEIVEELGLWTRPTGGRNGRRVLLNMISTADGRATVGGRSGPLSDRADRRLFHGLRGAADAVLVGAGTVRVERYGRIVPDASRRAERVRRGLSEEPLACIVSGRLAIEPQIPLLQDGDARVVFLTASAASVPDVAAQVEYVRASDTGHLDLAVALEELCERFDVHTILCEGGPHLACQLFAAGLVDELFLSLSPLLAGGEPAGGEALRMLAGGELEPPVRLELRSVLRSDSELFLRYAVRAPERVSRETMLSSSLAR